VKSKKAMAIELNMDERNLAYFKAKWPYMWLLINVLVRAEAESKLGRVVDSMTDAAIYGDSRDRRLYLEYFGHIKREVAATGGNTIVFVNDNLDRPQPKMVGEGKVGSESDEP
jgi:hypothetical protein